MMAHQHHHLFDLSSPPNAAMMASFDHGLAALHVDGFDDHMRGGGGVLGARVFADASSPWPLPVSLSLYNEAGAGGSSSLVGQQQLAAFAAPLAADMAAMGMQPFQLRSSKYLGPVKELLEEFCSLQGDLQNAMDGSKRAPKMCKWDDVKGSSSSSTWANLSLSSMDLLDLERRRARLLSMVQEVDKRYRRYRQQMRAVEASLEAVAGGGAAQVYTKLAMRAMSRHFRCLRDALVAQVRALRKAMGETRDAGGGGVLAAAPGATKGDTPRLRVLDQCLRQQRAFQQSCAVDSFSWRPQRGLPESAVAVLRAWLFEHFLHPYPNDVDKHILARQTGLSRSQVSNWFINARVRLWKPMIEDMYKEETEPESGGANKNPSATGAAAPGSGGSKHVQPHDHNYKINTTSSSTTASTVVAQISQHLRSGNPNSSSLIPSSIVPLADLNTHHHQFLQSYNNNNSGGGLHGGAVSLTLGLQQQPFASSSAMMQQKSLLRNAATEEEEAVLPYCRNLMGSQLLHDFAT